MSDDRYAPPTAALGDPSRERGTGRIDLGEAFREAWSATWENFGVLLGVLLVSFVVGGIAALTIVGIFLVVPVLAWGGTRFILNVLDGQGELADLFSGFSDYARVLGTMLVLMILIVLLYLVGQSVSFVGQAAGSSFLSVIGALVNLIWNFAVMPRFNFAWFYAVDQELGATEALQTAWNATSDQKLICLVLGILYTIIPIIGVLALIVGLIPAMMLVYLLQASAYRQLAGR